MANKEEIVPRGTSKPLYKIAESVSNVYLCGQVYHKKIDKNIKFEENEEVLARFKDGHLELVK